MSSLSAVAAVIALQFSNIRLKRRFHYLCLIGGFVNKRIHSRYYYASLQLQRDFSKTIVCSFALRCYVRCLEYIWIGLAIAIVAFLVSLAHIGNSGYYASSIRWWRILGGKINGLNEDWNNRCNELRLRSYSKDSVAGNSLLTPAGFLIPGIIITMTRDAGVEEYDVSAATRALICSRQKPVTKQKLAAQALLIS